MIQNVRGCVSRCGSLTKRKRVLKVDHRESLSYKPKERTTLVCLPASPRHKLKVQTWLSTSACLSSCESMSCYPRIKCSFITVIATYWMLRITMSIFGQNRECDCMSQHIYSTLRERKRRSNCGGSYLLLGPQET
jgi:hypothetical protein